jgi:hypothetical protein
LQFQEVASITKPACRKCCPEFVMFSFRFVIQAMFVRANGKKYIMAAQ